MCQNSKQMWQCEQEAPWELARRLRQGSSIQTPSEAVQGQPSNNGLCMYFLACLTAKPRATQQTVVLESFERELLRQEFC